MVVMAVVTSRSKSCQRSKNRQRVQKVSKVWKVCKGHWFGGMFNELPILRRFIDTKNCQGFYSFSSSFCGAKELSQYHFWIDYRYNKANEAVDTLSRFSSEKPRKSSSREHLNLSPFITNGPSTPKFVWKTHVFPPLLQLWDILRALRHHDDSTTRCARPPSISLILDMRSKRKRLSPGSERECLMTGRMSMISAKPVLRSWNHQNWADYRENSRTHCQEILRRPAIAPDTYC